MSNRAIITNKIFKTKEIFNKSESSSRYKYDQITNSSYNATIETNIKSGLVCTCHKKSSNSKKINLKRNINLCTCGERQVRSTLSENVNTINTTISNNSLQVQITENEEKEKLTQRKTLREELEIINWGSNLFIQIMERLQYLALGPPKLSVQFPDNLMINRTIKPIIGLIPIPDNYIQQQDHFMVISDIQKQEQIKEVKKIIPKFNILEKTHFEIFEENKKVELKQEEKEEVKQQPLVQQKHDINIISSQRMWKNPIEPVKTNKFGIEEQVKNWNELVKSTSANKIEYKGKVKEKKKEQKKEIIIHKPEYSLSQESKITVGGKGFKQKIWSPVPNPQGSITFEKVQKSESISESSDKNIITNDDYNNIKDMKMRPVIVTITKQKDNDEENWNETIDVFESILIKKINLNLESQKQLIKSRFEFNEKIINEKSPQKKYKINYIFKNKKLMYENK